MTAHDHVWRVTALNPTEGWKQHDKDGRFYFWRINACDVCGSWFSEGSYARFPEHPAVGEVLTPEPVEDGRLFA